MNRHDWDQRYREKEFVWSAGPNQFLVQEVSGMPPGRALDLACGEGRNAIWLASQGWSVTASDYSPVAIEKAKSAARSWVSRSTCRWQTPRRPSMNSLKGRKR